MILKGLTKKGKERVKRWGDQWYKTGGHGDKMLIVAVNDPTNTQQFPESMRWVNINNDVDFEVLTCGDGVLNV